MRGVLVLISVAVAAAALSACGSEGIDLNADASPEMEEGAQLFSERCSGCHTLKAAGAQGSANRSQRQQGPNLDQRKESYDDVIYAIANGGFSGAIMPQNIVVGDDADKVARFVEEYSGTDVVDSPRPGQP
ncbi:MAG TPA: c-type cytochrome [Solirubrobacterales bacterium]|nr:c-type cytochrome [Solirubrobacterales bacterium]